MTRAQIAAAIDEIPELRSLLYDLDLMPEQTEKWTLPRWKMRCIIKHFVACVRRVRKEAKK